MASSIFQDGFPYERRPNPQRVNILENGVLTVFLPQAEEQIPGRAEN